MRRAPQALLVLIPLFALASSVRAQTFKNGWHEDTKTGFKLKIPDKWEGVPCGVDEKWIVAKYLGDKALAGRKGDSAGYELKPQLRVIVFADEAKKIKPAEAKVEKTEDEKVISALKAAEVPYKDYKDYVKRNGQGGGFFFSSEKETKVGDIPCWQYEIKIEKLTVPRHVITWVFRGDAADYAVEYEVLEDHWEKFLPVFTNSLQSFKFIKREAANVGSSGVTGGGGGPGKSTSPSSPKERESWKSLSAKERADRRKSTEESRFQRAKEKLPAGWTIKNSKNFLVLTHCDAKSTDKIVDAAECCRNWLDKNLSAISDEYALRAVIRICADRDEYALFHKGSRDAWGTGSREIVTYKDANMGSRRGGYDILFGAMLNEYIYDKDPLLVFDSPPWVMAGLEEAVGSASPEGGTLKLGADPTEADRLRDKSAKKLGAKELMESPIQKLYENPAGPIYSARLVRYFLATKKDFITNYLKAAIEVAAENDKADSKSDHKEAKTEEEEEAQAKERRESGKKRSAETIQKVHEKACKWSDKEWQALETAFAAAK